MEDVSTCVLEQKDTGLNVLPSLQLLKYSRTPSFNRPLSKSDWSGRKGGVVVHEGLDYFITCALWYTRITVLTVSSTLRTSFAECIAERGKTQRPIRYSVFRHARSLPV